MNWDDARFFLAVARNKTLRKAAQDLNVDQATVGRRIVSFEKDLGSRLFIRTPKSFLLSAFGEGMLEEVMRIENAVQAISRKASYGDKSFSGNVRIATTDSLAEVFVLPAIKKLRETYPDITITLLTSLNFSDISYRGADLAIRGARPASEELIIKRLMTIEMGLYASQAYLDKSGNPSTIAELNKHKLVMFPADLVPRHRKTLCGSEMTNPDVVLECNSQLLLQSAARNGIGISLLSSFLAGKDDALIRLFPEQKELVDIWLVVHPDLHKAARVRAVIDVLEETFSCYAARTDCTGQTG